MKIVTLFFACVALRNFAIGAMQEPNPHPGIAPEVDHVQKHQIKIKNPVPNQSELPEGEVIIAKLVNNELAEKLHGKLVTDEQVTSCNSRHGYAIVDINDSVRLYACLQPDLRPPRPVNSRLSGPNPLYSAAVERQNRPRLEAKLAPSNGRSTSESRDLLGRLGHVRFIRQNEIVLEGDLHKYELGFAFHPWPSTPW
ncbi:uncharacterized protein LOC117171645 isoform X2 [Belonocnema kinseyi]|uniref:uncharacterized protein LOC117171645 isoform X2 n=1 Tax=Belonocnema kinseyi TaxID=2817044 RepID=UPI00143D692C|nr:uncharacterized protein LOC117171645 isoform X2 [Belonocnema kinseyi]